MAFFGRSVATITKKFTKIVSELEAHASRQLDLADVHLNHADHHHAKRKEALKESSAAFNIAGKIKSLVEE